MSAPRTSNPAELRGRTIGALVLGFFAVGWTNWGTSSGVPSAVQTALAVVAGVLLLVLAAAAVALFRRARAIPPGDEGGAERAAAGRRFGRRFGLIVLAEFAVIAVAARVFAVSGRAELIPAFVCLVVGVHFFPLSRLFHVRVYDRTGVAMCAIAGATAIAAPLLGAPVLWTLIPGIGAAVTLFATSGVVIGAEQPWRRRWAAGERGMPLR